MMNGLNGVISAVIKGSNYGQIQNCGNFRTIKNTQLGIGYYNFSIGENEEIRQKILEYLRSDNFVLLDFITLDLFAINDDEIMNIILNKLKDKEVSIRIADQGYKLTKKDYEKLKKFSKIYVDYCDEDLLQNDQIVLQEMLFKENVGVDQPVLERREKFEDFVIRDKFFVDRRLSEYEFERLAEKINTSEFYDVSIELAIADSGYYEEFLQKLQKYNVKNNTNICLIGYPLEDNSELYRNLMKYPFEIDIEYSLCKDMVQMYEKEPYTLNRLYRSQIEGEGKTSINNYIEILNLLETFSNDVKKNNFSPLETAIYAKKYIDSNYIYDPDYLNFDTDEWDNINLSQMINHNSSDGVHKRAICAGFATLYSALLRKCGIPMFKYSTTGHARNIGRIVDEKYGIDTLGVVDVTWDLPSSDKSYKYDFFMKSPRDFLHVVNNDGNAENMTIASSLVLPLEDYYRNYQDSTMYYEYFYSPLYCNPMGYTARMLQLMGYEDNLENGHDVHRTIHRICKNGNLEGIDDDILLKAVQNVANSSIDISENEKNDMISAVLNREDIKMSSIPAIYSNSRQENISVNPLTLENVDYYSDAYEALNPDFHPIYGAPITIKNNDNSATIDNNTIADNDAVVINDATNINNVNTDNNEVNTYIVRILNYVQEKEISIFDYYLSLAKSYRGKQADNIEDFEKNNPFLKANDYSILNQTNDSMIEFYFASYMERTILSNRGVDFSEYDILEHEKEYINALKETTYNYANEAKRK